MSIKLINLLPDSAKDIKLNLMNVLSEEGSPGLTIKQIYAISLACAYALKNQKIIEYLHADSAQILIQAELEAAKSAASIMAMNNIYYRFTHLISDKTYKTMPAKLRMNVIANSGVDKIDFELNCLAVSIINGCGVCIDAHANTLINAGLSQQAIQSTARISAVMNSVVVSE